MNCETRWEHDTPAAPGWYAIEYCWDPEEGVFPGASYWNGKNWIGNWPVVAYAGSFLNEKEASIWAEKNDADTLCEQARANTMMSRRYTRAKKQLICLESLRGKTSNLGKLEALILSKRNRIVALTPYVVDVRP